MEAQEIQLVIKVVAGVQAVQAVMLALVQREMVEMEY
jgi:hypothetical protein